MFPGSSVVEQPAVNRLVAGSNPARGANIFKHLAGHKNRRFWRNLRHIYANRFCYGILAAMPLPQKLRAVTVENPWFSRAHPVDASNTRQITAVVNIRESDPTLAVRGKLDPA